MQLKRKSLKKYSEKLTESYLRDLGMNKQILLREKGVAYKKIKL